MYFNDIRMMHLLIDEIGQLGISTLYSYFLGTLSVNVLINMIHTQKKGVYIKAVTGSVRLTFVGNP